MLLTSSSQTGHRAELDRFADRQAPTPRFGWDIGSIDLTPDLGARIGSLEWWRGLVTCVALISVTWALSPKLAEPVLGYTPPPLAGSAWENARAQAIAPLAWGADTGQRLAATDLARPLSEAPDRPVQPFSSALSEGDSLAALLRRAGTTKSDIAAINSLVAAAMPIKDIRPGTRFEGLLGGRARKSDPRPIETLNLQPAFDFRLIITRTPNGLTMRRKAIAIDTTPLRIQGLAGSSLYKSLRAAGVPSRDAATYLKAIATRISVGRDISAGDRFDVILEQKRAATGEVELGDMLFAGLDMNGRKVQLVKWLGQEDEASADWFDVDGGSRREGFMGMPVSGRISSPYGMRLHPILGFYRMHRGIDIACPFGSPVYAVISGTVDWAGFKGGYGNFIGIEESRIGTGYAHLSRILVRSGERVTRGQLVGYSGNSGLSTGPHLHFEVYRDGLTVNPRGFQFSSLKTLSGRALRAFKDRVASLLSIPAGPSPRRQLQSNGG